MDGSVGVHDGVGTVFGLRVCLEYLHLINYNT